MWHIHYKLPVLYWEESWAHQELQGSGAGAAQAQGILSKSTQQGRRLLYQLPLVKILLLVELNQLSQTIICIINQMPLYKAFHWWYQQV